jgi:hypothetical protein
MIKPELAESLSEIHYTPPKTIANKFVNQIAHVEDKSEGIRKIVLDDPTLVQNMMQSGMPSDAAALMQQMMGAPATSTAAPDVSGLPPEAAALMQQLLAQQTVKEDPNAGAEMIRKRPEYLEKAMKEASSRDRMEVDIENSNILDLYVNKSTKKEVIETLKSISKANYEDNEQEQIFYYTDVGFSFYFDENGIINEIEFDEKYRKQTTKGLKIGDPIEKAIEIYGTPRMKSAKGAIWNRFSILLRDRENEIKLLRLKVRE